MQIWPQSVQKFCQPAQYLSLLVFPTRLFNQFDKLCKISLPFSQTSKAALLEKWNNFLSEQIFDTFFALKRALYITIYRLFTIYATKDLQHSHVSPGPTPQCHNKKSESLKFNATHTTQCMQLKLGTLLSKVPTVLVQYLPRIFCIFIVCADYDAALSWRSCCGKMIKAFLLLGNSLPLCLCLDHQTAFLQHIRHH